MFHHPRTTECCLCPASPWQALCIPIGSGSSSTCNVQHSSFFCLTVPRSRLQRLAASQVTSPRDRDTCGAAPRDTPMMEWWSNLDTAEMSISSQHPGSPISVAGSRHQDTGRCGRPQLFRFHPSSREAGGWVTGGGGRRPRGRSAGSRTEARPSYDDLCQSSRLRKRVPLCRHPCRYRAIRLTWTRCRSPSHHHHAPHTTPRSWYVHCSTRPSNEKSHCHPYLSSLFFPKPLPAA